LCATTIHINSIVALQVLPLYRAVT